MKVCELKGGEKVIHLKNDKLSVEICELGAEIVQVYHLEHQLTYMWKKDSAFWGRTAPILFPIVGRLAEDTYLFEDEAYSLSQHGFARDLLFEIISQTDQEAWFELKAGKETLAQYPFQFRLKIGYELKGEKVIVNWEVNNLNDKVMPFSIGAHPAFSTQLQKEENLSDYYLHFETNEGVETYQFDHLSGLASEEKVEIIEKLKFLPLSQGLFEDYPTLIMEGETGITLKSYNHDHEVRVAFSGFPYVGIWSPINAKGEVAPFVCIEPWFGMADTVTKPQDIVKKKGIQLLEPKKTFIAQYSMEFK